MTTSKKDNDHDDGVSQVFFQALTERAGLSAARIQLCSTPEYETNRQKHFNLDMICQPLLFVVPKTTQEVSKAVRGYKEGLKQLELQKTSVDLIPRLTICGGRHSTRSFQDHSVVLDLSQMKQVEVEVDPAKHHPTVSIQGGVKIQEMLDALQPYGLSPVTGTHGDTGVIGLTLGGGQGPLSKKYGPAVDQIVAVELVLADGSICSLDKDDPSKNSKNAPPNMADDIWFNIRGGGGNIGVVTKLTMKVYPIRNVAMMEKLNIVFTQQGVTEVLTRYGEWSLKETPDDCMSLIILPLRAPIVVSVACSCDTSVIPQDVDAATAKVKRSDVPSLEALDNNRLGSRFRLPGKLSVKGIHKEALEELSKDEPGHYYYTNLFFPTITPEIAAVLAEAQTRKRATGVDGVIFIFNSAGEATASVLPEETAFEMRAPKYWILTQTSWKTCGIPDKDAAARQVVVDYNQWIRRALLEVGGQKTAHAVTNQEQDFGAETDYGLFYRASNKERLVRTQRELDPDGIFRVNQTVS